MSGDLGPGDVVAGRYRLERRLGEGGMGTVWTAIQTITERPVALKLIKMPADTPADRQQALMARLVREARAACAVRHPNVVHIYDVIELDDGAPAIVMELLEGESLRERLDRQGRLSLDEFAPILLAVLAAVRAAHAAGIVHRDLKPANIFLAQADDLGTEAVKVLDFGIAKVAATYADDATVTSSLTGTGALLGTPHFMSPEQVLGEDVGPRSDFWSLGVIAYQALSGVLPTDVGNVARIFRTITDGSFEPLERCAPELPEEVTALVGRLLAVSPDDRPGDSGEVRAVFERFTDGSEAAATPQTPAQEHAARSSDDSNGEVDGLSETVPASRSDRERQGSAKPPADAPATAWPARAKWALWILATSWLPLLLLLGPDTGRVFTEFASAMLGATGVGPSILARVLQGLIVAGLAAAIWALGLFWSRGSYSRWLLGDGLLAMGALAFIAFVNQYTRYTSQLDLLTLEQRSYVKVERGSEFAGQLAFTTSSYLNTTALISLVFGWLSFMVVLAILFVRPPDDRRPSWGRLGASLAASAAVTAGLISIGYGDLGGTGSPLFLGVLLTVWILVAFALERGSRGAAAYLQPLPSGARPPLAYLALKHGLLALVFLISLSIVVAIVEVFVGVADAVPDRRAELMVGVGEALVGWSSALGWLVLGLVLIAAVAFARSVAAGFGSSWKARAGEAARLVALALAALAYPLSAQAAFSNFVDLQRTGWTLRNMLPAQTHFLDAAPRSWEDLRNERFAQALRGEPVSAPFARRVPREQLLEQLRAETGCLSEHATRLADAQPTEAGAATARCLSPAQAQLYCTAIGARLPTPGEWKATLEDLLPRNEVQVPRDDGARDAFVRTSAPEWAMESKHGSPAFFAVGGPDGPAEVPAGKVDEQIRFRCAFTF